MSATEVRPTTTSVGAGGTDAPAGIDAPAGPDASAGIDASSETGAATGTDARDAAARDLQTQLVHFKRTLHLIRTGSNLHHRAPVAGIPVLGVLHRCGSMRTTTIAAEFGLDPSTVSRQVDALVRSGHAEKVPDPDDGRAALVQLTEQGRTELAAHFDAISATLSGVLDDWSTDDLHQLTTLLGRLNDDVFARFASPTTQENQ